MIGRSGVGVIVAGVMVSAALVFSGVASAATTVGNSCVPNQAIEVNAMVVGLAKDPSNPLPIAIPSPGVITSWTFNGEAIPAGVAFEAQLKVLRPTGVPKEFTVVGETPLTPTVTGSNSFSTRIPVQSGDLLAEAGLATNGVASEPAVQFCKGLGAAEVIGATGTNGTLGTPVMIFEEESELGVPVTAAVEPDADGDGYGDETQDKCPTDASTQGPCPVKAAPTTPAPPAPITLSESGAAKKGLVTVTVTASAQADVTVAGSVKLGKGKTMKLSGGTQTVTPGNLAKFTVPFPAKLKTALKQMPKSKKLTLSLAASAPGATTTNLTVKVPGQMKLKPRHKSKA
jgi:hypothetical protein